MGNYDHLIPKNNSYSQFIPTSKIQPSESILDKASEPIRKWQAETKKNIEDRFITFGGVPREEVLPTMAREQTTGIAPMAGQFIGGELGGGLGATGGAMVGQGINQLIRAIPNQKIITPGKPNMGSVLGEGVTTGLMEGLTRGTGNIFFKRQIAASKLKKAGRYIEDTEEKVFSHGKQNAKYSDLRTEDILNGLERDTSEIIRKKGSVNSELNYWKNYLKKKSQDPMGEYMTPQEIKSMERGLGSVVDFSASGKDVANREANAVAKKWGGTLSNKFEQLAKKSGQTKYKQQKDVASKIYSKYSELDPNKAGEGMGTRIVSAGVASALTHNPIIGGLTYLAEKALQKPGFKNAAYKFVTNPLIAAMGKTGKLVTTAETRKLLD